MAILVSACLLGVKCRYDGKSKPSEKIIDLAKKETLIPICPEQLGGRPTPRNPVEVCNRKVVEKNGTDYTKEFQLGAKEVLKIANIFGCKKAILKSKSPSCGFGKIYDGTFSRTLIDGNGITAELLSKNGIKIITEDEI